MNHAQNTLRAAMYFNEVGKSGPGTIEDAVIYDMLLAVARVHGDNITVDVLIEHLQTLQTRAKYAIKHISDIAPRCV